MRKLLGVFLVLLTYNLFFFPLLVPLPGHVGFVLLMTVMLTATWLAFLPKRIGRREKCAGTTTAIALIGAFATLLEANPVSAFFLGAMSGVLLVLTGYLLLLSTNTFGGIVEFLLSPLMVAMAWFKGLFDRPEAWKQLKTKITLGERSTRTIRGLLLSIPLLFIVIGLLSSADPVFGKVVQSWFNWQGDWLPRLIHSGLILLALVPLSLSSISGPFRSPGALTKWKRFGIEMATITGALALILGLFLVIQFTYVFASVPETQLHQFGINTYSEYVRRGFMEMILVTVIAYGVAGLGYVIFRAGKQAGLKWVNLVLLGELGLFILSIFRRVYLYQLFHGLTRIRVYGLAVVVYLLGLVLLMAGRFWLKTKRPWYLYEIGLGIALVFITAWIKPDVLIATRFPPTVNQEIDYTYLTQLSIDALPAWKQALAHAEAVMDTTPKTATPSAETVRQVIYASDALGSSIRTYQMLAAKYGTKADYRAFVGDEDMYVYFHKRGILVHNPAEAKAYQQLRQGIDPQELVSLHKRLMNYLYALPAASRDIPLDRSNQSPLL